MKHLFRLLAVVLLLAWSSPDALAQSSPPPNPNYTRFNTKADGDIPTPAANSVNLFFNGTGFRFKDEAAAFTNIGGIGVGVGSGTAGRIPQFGAGPTLIDSKMTTSGGSSGTWTLYDTGGTGVTRLVLRAGAAQGSTSVALSLVNTVGAETGSFSFNGSESRVITDQLHDNALSFRLLTGTSTLQFSDTSTILWAGGVSTGAKDTGLTRSAAGILKITDGSTGQGGIGISDSATNTVTDALILRHATSDAGFGQDGFGTGLLFQGEDEGGNMNSMAQIQAVYTDSANGSEDADLRMYGMVAGTLTRGLTFSPNLRGAGPGFNSESTVRLEANGGQFTIGVHNSGGDIVFGTWNVADHWAIKNTTGHFVPGADNTYDIGTSSARVRNAYLSQSIQGATSVTLTAATDDPFVQIDVASGSFVGGYIEYTIHADDATDYQSRSGILPFSIVNKGGTESVTIGTVGAATEVFAESAGGSTLSNTFTTDNATGSNNVRIRANAVSSLTETTLAIKCRVVITSGTATITFNP